MQKKILLLGSISTEPGEQEAVTNMASFVQGALGSDADSAQVYFCHMDELGYVVHNGGSEILDLHNDRSVSDYDMVFFRGKLRGSINDVALVSYFLHKRGIPSINSAYANRRAAGKVPQMFQLHDLGLPIPYSVLASSQHLGRLIGEHLSYPVVVKDSHGSHGNDNYLVRSEHELSEILQKNPHIRFIAQEFIPNDSDYRILIAGKRQLIIERKAAGDSHLNNTSQGGSASLVKAEDFPADIIAEARKFAEFCEYELAGVDVLFHKETGNHYFLEINSQPQIATGAFVAEKSELIGAFFKEILKG